MFTVYSDNDRGSTLISNLFIDKYMRDANDAQLKVYLYLLRMMNAGRTTSIPDMADQFNHTERDVMRSLRYWERRGLIALEYSAAGELMSLRMISPRPDRTLPRRSFPLPDRILPCRSFPLPDRVLQRLSFPLLRRILTAPVLLPAGTRRNPPDG